MQDQQELHDNSQTSTPKLRRDKSHIRLKLSRREGNKIQQECKIDKFLIYINVLY